MIQSFLVLSLRNLFRKNRTFTIVNIAGLSVGIASMLLVALFIYDEYSFDRHHRNADRIYRIVLDFKEEGNSINWARTSAPIGQYLRGVYPEIEKVVRIRKNPGTDLLSHDETKFFEEKLLFADSSLFRVFDVPLITGNPATALKEKNSIVITEALARKYFRSVDVMGQSLRLNNSIDLKITGIMADMLANSHFVADAFITFTSLDELIGTRRLEHWGWMDHYTYLLLSPDAQPGSIEARFPEFLKTYAPEWVAEKEVLSLQPLTSIHLHSDRKDEITPNSRESYSYILGTIAFFILLMAVANFVNLSTAAMVSRFKEISIQKALGAGRIQLAFYFWVESLLMCFVSLLMAFLLAYLVLPYFNLAIGKHVSLSDSAWLIAPALALVLIISGLSSIAPTIQAARVSVFRERGTGYTSRRSRVRSALITFQVCISILLVMATWIAHDQFTFLKSSRIGFNSDNVIAIAIKDRSKSDKHLVLSNEINQLPGVEKVSYSSSMPACNNAYTYTYTFAGSVAGEQGMAAFLVDAHFFELYGIRLREGRFPVLDTKDTLAEVVLNRSAVEFLGLTQPIGQRVAGQVDGTVVGVVEDFNYESLHNAVKPMIMYSYTPNFRFVSVKFNGDIQSKLAEMEKLWQNFYPGYPLEYFFIDEKISQLYGSEFQLSNAYTSFSVIAILIAGIGLVGLTSYLLSRKLKEMSIRKVFGSTVMQLIGWVYSGYTIIVIVAIPAAWALGYYWMTRWLEGFSFKVELRLYHFILPAVVMIVILMLTTIIQTFRAARTNPSDNLRDE